MSDYDLLSMFGAFLGGAWVLTGIYISKLAGDAKTWRDEATEMRDLWRWERERAEWLKRELLDAKKQPRDGVYR